MARILVVDDQPQILKLLESLLTQNGHLVTLALDSFDAMEKLEAQTFEMVITDAVMPGGVSGFDLIKTIRAKYDALNMAVILLTGRREKRDVARGIQAGADDYVVKPLDPDLFLLKVESLLERRGAGKIAFTQCVVSENAQYSLDVRIVGLSELGLTFESSQPFHVGSKIHLNSDLYAQIGIESPLLRVVSSKAHDKGTVFAVEVHFIGLSESSLQPIRVWIRSRSLRSA